MSAAQHTADRCYVCGKTIKGHSPRQDAFLEDDDHRTVPVGPDCFRRIVKAGYDGVQTKRGPRVFVEKYMAAKWSEYSAALHAAGETP